MMRLRYLALLAVIVLQTVVALLILQAIQPHDLDCSLIGTNELYCQVVR